MEIFDWWMLTVLGVVMLAATLIWAALRLRATRRADKDAE